MVRVTRQNAVFVVTVAVLAALLIVLAVLQYRWTRDLGRAASVRMQAELQQSMVVFRQDLQRNLGEIGLGLQPHGDITRLPAARSYVEQVLLWRQTSPHRGLVKFIYIAQRGDLNSSHLLKLNLDSGRYEQVVWPSNLSGMQKLMEFADAHPGPPPQVQPQLGPGHPWPPLLHHSPWILDEGVPALIYPVLQPPTLDEEVNTETFLIITLDLQAIGEQLFPVLVQKQFTLSGPIELDVAVLGGDPDQPYVIYSSRPGFPEKLSPRADATLGLGGLPTINPDSGPESNWFQLQPLQPAGQSGDFEKWKRDNGADHSPFSQDWKLVVEPRRGSLETAVARLRRRNLAVSFGILFVLAGTVAVLVAATHRARRLAELQMKFLAGVTHELRTPVSVILSASENIKDGLVHRPGQLPLYGGMIHRQAKQLMVLIEQVLQFAATHQRRIQYRYEPVSVPDIIEDALANLHSEDTQIVRDYEPDLPLIMADTSALLQCLQNIIGNAIKYGGEQHWMRIRLSTTCDVPANPEVAIAIQDHGIGISPEDIRHIFEPFYRSASVIGSSIHGAGLGLALAKAIVEETGGRIGVESELGVGTSFTVQLPAIDEKHIQAESFAAQANASL